MLNKSISHSTFLLSLLFALPTPALGFWESKETTREKAVQFVKKNPKKLMAAGATALFLTMLWWKWGKNRTFKKTKQVGKAAALGYTMWPMPLLCDDKQLAKEDIHYPNVHRACAIPGFCAQAIGTYAVVKKLWALYKNKF